MNDMEDRIKSEQSTIQRITNSDLVCHDCAFAFDDSVVLGNTSKCSKYSMKPASIIAGGKCELKVKR